MASQCLRVDRRPPPLNVRTSHAAVHSSNQRSLTAPVTIPHHRFALDTALPSLLTLKSEIPMRLSNLPSVSCEMGSFGSSMINSFHSAHHAREIHAAHWYSRLPASHSASKPTHSVKRRTSTAPTVLPALSRLSSPCSSAQRPQLF